MNQAKSGIAGVVLSVLLAACGGHTTASGPLVGAWSVTETADGLTEVTTLDLNGDGTASAEVSLSGSIQGESCSGSLLLSGYTWTSLGSTLTISGTLTCSGTIDCGGAALDCSALTTGSGMGGMSIIVASTCTYTLSGGDDSLSLTCTADGGTPSTTVLTRQG